MKAIVLASAALILSACVSQQAPVAVVPPPAINNKLVDLSLHPVATIEQLASLSPEQHAEIAQYKLQPEIRILSKRKQAAKFIERKMVNFNYEGKNLSASEAYEQQHGNCMSLALLAYAIANAFDVEITFQRMHTIPMLVDASDDLLVISDHVRSFLADKPTSEDVEPSKDISVIDYFPDRLDRSGAMITEDEFIAMLYRNLAADALIENDPSLALSLLNQAIGYAPNFSPVLDMIAIAHRRLGDVDSAKAFYQYALEYSSNSKIHTLNNFYVLLQSLGDKTGADRITEQLRRLDDESPYGWIFVARDAIAAGDFPSAKLYLKRFLTVTDYYYPAYVELAKVEFELGNINASKEALNKALTYTQLPEKQRQYKAKLAWLAQQ
ncbi:hypothetical protein FLM48_09320 [Shewanella sp. Scap07]|uniref:tetratricopeptide repeat protein n=1 Tax=Shewanella sp. Scap07 TaxID=2589987 RepID=UPI0015BA6E4B|nr:hypothetical protein [Shewanella sp. Scap07]QLE85271.1 hypothetical protein FLM48_09320 [Shewanella sp. Scap07]